MTPKHIAAYADFRRTIFDHKIECGRHAFVAKEPDLLRAASSLGPARELTPLTGGSLSTCYRFDTAGGSYVLRVPANEQLAPSLIVEDWAARLASEVHFPAVVPLLTDTSHYLAPFSFQILPFAEGDGEFKVSSLKSLHSTRPGGFGPIDPRSVTRGARGLFDSWRDYLTCQLDDHLIECVRLNAMTDHEAERAEDLIRGLRPRFDATLLHNDLSPRNIIGGQVLDWDMCIAGDPLFELASMCALYADRPIEPTIQAYYGNHRPLGWETTFWAYYLRISVARTVRRAKHNLPEDPRYPKASARIQLALRSLS